MGGGVGFKSDVILIYLFKYKGAPLKRTLFPIFFLSLVFCCCCKEGKWREEEEEQWRWRCNRGGGGHDIVFCVSVFNSITIFFY